MPPTRGDTSAVASTAPQRYGYTQWKREYARSRCEQQSFGTPRLPSVLNDAERPKTCPIEAGEADRSLTTDFWLKRGARVEESLDELRAKLAEAQTGREKDHEVQRKADATRRAVWEARRVLQPLELEEARRRADCAAETFAEASAVRVAAAEASCAAVDVALATSSHARSMADQEAAVAARLRTCRQKKEIEVAAQDAEVAALQAQADALAEEITATEFVRDAALAGAAEDVGRLRALRWRALCEILVERQQCEVLRAAAAELDADAHAVATECDKRRQKREGDEKLASYHEEKAAEMSERVQRVEIDVERVLAEVLGRPFVIASRSVTPAYDV